MNNCFLIKKEIVLLSNNKKRKFMQVITIEGPVLSLDKKERLAKEISALASEIMNVPLDAYVVFVKENPYENMSQGGVLISEKLKKQ